MKAQSLFYHIDVPSAETVADTFRAIGSGLLLKNDFLLAAKWLRRARDIINCQPIDRLSVEGVNSNLEITHGLVQSLLGMNEDSATSEARDMVAHMEAEVGDKPVVLHWKLEILQKTADESSNPETYASILSHMVRTFDSTEQSFRFLLHHIEGLRAMDAQLAGSLLHEYLMERVLPSGNVDWLNRLIVRIVRLATMGSNSSGWQDAQDLFELLSTVHERIGKPLKPEVIGAAQSVSARGFKIDLLLTLAADLEKSRVYDINEGLTDSRQVVLHSTTRHIFQQRGREQSQVRSKTHPLRPTPQRPRRSKAHI